MNGATTLILPLLSIVLALAAATIFVALRQPRGEGGPKCRKCGYDVTGLAGDVCPECGSDLRVVGVLKPSDPRPIRLWVALLLWAIGATIPVVFFGQGFAEKIVPIVLTDETWRRIDSRVPGVEVGLFVKTIGTRVVMPNDNPARHDVPAERVELQIERPPTAGKLIVGRGDLTVQAVSGWLATQGYAGPQANVVASAVVAAIDDMATPAGDRPREFASAPGGAADLFADRPFPFWRLGRGRAGTLAVHVLTVVFSAAIWIACFWLAWNWRRLVTAPASATVPAPR